MKLTDFKALAFDCYGTLEHRAVTLNRPGFLLG